MLIWNFLQYPKKRPKKGTSLHFQTIPNQETCIFWKNTFSMIFVYSYKKIYYMASSIASSCLVLHLSIWFNEQDKLNQVMHYQKHWHRRVLLPCDHQDSDSFPKLKNICVYILRSTNISFTPTTHIPHSLYFHLNYLWVIFFLK